MSARKQRMVARLQGLTKSIEIIMDAAIDAEGVPREFTEAETKSLADLNKEADNVTAIIEQDDRANARNSKHVAPVTPAKVVTVDADDVDDDAPVVSRATKPGHRDIKGVMAKLASNGNSQIVRVKGNAMPDPATVMAITACSIMRAKTLGQGTPYDQMEAMGYGEMANEMFDAKVKALSTTGVGSGAEVMPQTFSTDFIEFLYPQSSILRANPTKIDLSTGTLRIPAGNMGTSASYRTQNSDIAYSEITLREIAMSAKELAAISAVPNELLQRSPIAVAEILRNDMATAFTLTMDYAALRGTGAGNSPIGMRQQAVATNIFTAAVPLNPSIADIDTLVVTAFNKMRAANLPQLRPTWLMSNRTSLYLSTKRGANGEKIYPTMEGKSPTFWGVPVILSNQIVDNGGVTTDETEIYLVDMGHFYMGETGQMSLSVSEEASYVAAGVTISAFSRNQSVVRLVGAHDFLLRRPQAAVVIKGVRWY